LVFDGVEFFIQMVLGGKGTHMELLHITEGESIAVFTEAINHRVARGEWS